MAAAIEVLGARLGWAGESRTWVALGSCFLLRWLSMRYRWHLPRAAR